MYSNLRNYRIIVSASFIDSNLPISKIRILLTLSSNYPRQWELKYFLVNHSILVQLLPQSNYMFRNHTSLLRKNEKRSLCLIRLDEKSEVINSSLPWHDRSKQRNNEQGEIYKIERNPAFHVARLWRTCYEEWDVIRGGPGALRIDECADLGGREEGKEKSTKALAMVP